ncbi:hypothetical protein MBEHAL_1904 [Halarchaeum acidiphilum MH1-52-1]|uniref:VOC domain-containing protein n=1 Tax=Halarchaeum acidiphilum MH1-52-1 TaxID=1261545 RepID=U3A652_9EURY|nr:VOC family protein [Halarchaeum acidiphilum]GAD53144.1 hypothetical protein MBEHAL_1904 [Halarchaeum acidiphilum MH1-52-1]
MEIRQVFVMTSDLERSRAFYAALGFDITEEGSRSVEFDTGAARLKIEEDFDEETLAAFGLEPPGAERGDGAVIVLGVDDIDSVADRAEDAVAAHGGEMLTGPRDVDWGRRLCLVRDPDGYVLELSAPIEG